MLGLSLSLAAAAVSDHVAVLTDQVAMPHWDGASVTVKRYGNGRVAGAVEAPTVYRDMIPISQPSENMILAESQKFTGFNIYAKPYLLGATVDIYRVTGGVMAAVRRSTVIGGAVDRWVEISNRRDKTEEQAAPKAKGKKDKSKGKAKGAAAGSSSTRVDALSYDYAFSSFNRQDVPYWFAVAGVDGAGNIGPKSAALPYAPKVTKGKAEAQNKTSSVAAFSAEMAALDAPANLTGKAAATGSNLVRLSWAAVPGAAGYVVYLAFADPATEIVDQPYLELSADPVPLLAGDVAILSKKFLTQRPDEINPRVWGTNDWSAVVPAIVSNKANDPVLGTVWEWGRFDAADPKPAEHLGDWFLRRHIAPGAAIEDGRYFEAGLGQSFYQTLRPGRTWRWRARLRANAPVTVTLTLPGSLPGARFALTTAWQECIHEFSVTELDRGKRPGNWTLAAKAGAAPLMVDYCEVELGDTSLPMYIDEFPMAPGTFVRDQTQVIAGNSTSDADTVTNISGQGARVSTLHTLRLICEHFDARPWIQLEWHLPKEDWLDIAAYLAAPVDSGHPMALKRAAQGHTVPWTEAFARIVFEFGNESWNRGIAAFWATPSMADAKDGTAYKAGDVYGLWCRMITDWMRESPFWPALEARVEWFLGGWARGDHGTLAAARFPAARYIGIAAYNGGWDEGGRIPREEGAFLSAMLSYAPLNGGPGFARLAQNTRKAAEATGRIYGTDLLPAIYEAGPGYQLNGLNHVKISEGEALVQEVVMKSRGSGTATLDNLLMSAQHGLWGANFYKIGRGDLWNSTSFNGETDVDFPPYTLPRIVTAEIAPCAVYAVTPFRPLQHSLPDREGAVTTVDSAAVYALRSTADPTTWMLAFVNRRIDPSVLNPDDPDYRSDQPNLISIKLRTNWTRAVSLTEWANTGNFREHNRYPVGKRLTATGDFVPDPLCVAITIKPIAKDLPADLALLSVDVPAGGCILWKLTGVA